MTATFGLRAEQLRQYGMVGPEVEIDDGATAQTRMLALLGRVG